MPIHDWTRVDAGVFHGFHFGWIAEIRKALNKGLLPKGYYADAEQHTSFGEKKEADLLSLHESSASAPGTLPEPPEGGGAAVLVETAIGQRTARRVPKPIPRQRRLVIRHTSGHRVVAILEVVPLGNKDRRRHALEFAGKMAAAVRADIHVTILDLFPPTRSASRGLHNEVWREFDRTPVLAPPGRPLALTAFVAATRPQIFFEFTAVGGELPPFLLPLSPTRGVILPLAETYADAFDAGPPYLHEALALPPAGA